MREFIVKGFFVCCDGSTCFVVSKNELYSLLADGCKFERVRPLYREDFKNSMLFEIEEVKHA